MPRSQVSSESTYRSPREEDFQQLADIYNHAVMHTATTFDTEPRAPEYFRAFTPGDHSHRMLVAEVDGVISGYVGVTPFKEKKAYAQTAEVMIYLHPEYRGQMLGDALMRELHSGGFLRGLHVVLALTNRDNGPARRLLERHGYVLNGELVDVGWKFERWHSVVIYQRTLDA